MESFEFLGGRYNRPEQIMSGPVQAFRAQNAANGRTVFIHRVSTKEAPEEQSALLKLLSRALVKSADAKRLVLDFGEERGYWYVVTGSEPQCVLLREWLQLEIDTLEGNAGKYDPPPGAPVGNAPKPNEPSTPRMPPPLSAEAGEFTTFLKGRPAAGSSPSTPSYIPPTSATRPANAATPPGYAPIDPLEATLPSGEFARLRQKMPGPVPEKTPVSDLGDPKRAGVPPPPPPPPPPAQPTVLPAPGWGGQSGPGEFTSFFKTGDAGLKTPQQSASTPQRKADNYPAQSTPEEKPEGKASEFTSFFKPGLPIPPSSPHVQRPNTPVSLPPQSGKAGDGEFTKVFSRPPGTTPPSSPPERPSQNAVERNEVFDFGKQEARSPNDLSARLFGDGIDLGKAAESSKPAEGEFTKMFRTSGSEAPPVQPHAVVAAANRSLLDESAEANNSYFEPQKLPPITPPDAGAGKQPGTPDSEFTRVERGWAKPQGDASGSAGAPSSGAAKAGAGGMPLGIQPPSFTPPAIGIPSMGSVGGSMPGASASAGAGGVSVSSALGSAHLGAPAMPMPPAIPAPQLRMPNMQGAPAAGTASKASKNKNVIILFVIIGVLAVLLVLGILILMNSK